MNVSRPCLVLFIAAFLFIAPATAVTTVQAVPASVTLTPGENTTVDIVIDTLPKGISGAKMNVSLSNGAVANITDISYAGWANLGVTEDLPAKEVLLKAIDLNHQVESGAEDVTFATLTLTGVSTGTTAIEVDVLKMDDDKGYPVNNGSTEETTSPTSVPTTSTSSSSGNGGGDGGSSSSGTTQSATETSVETIQTQTSETTLQPTVSPTGTGFVTIKTPAETSPLPTTTDPQTSPVGILMPILAMMVLAVFVLRKR